ncbi:MAG: peptidylprolyl isomerase, partial [Methanococcaceae archaeon]
VFISVALASCGPDTSKIVVAEFGNEKVTMNEFENVYVKNAGSLEIAKKDSLSKLQNFLDLYVNFKMKLKDASSKGFDKDSSLQAELNDYKEKVGVSYLLEKEMVEPGIKDLYEKRKYELRVSHLMIRPDTLSDEKARAYANSLLARIKKGENYEELVKKYSDDIYSKATGGDIYYITAGTIVPEFENAAYATPVGEIYPEVVKTKYGYHILKVTEKKERIPQIRASHILIPFKEDTTKADTVLARKKIEEVKAQLNKGGDFAALAIKYSRDPGSAGQGGDLGFFERRMMVKEFDEAAFKLKPGQISDIIKTNYGFHIIKVTAVKPYPSFDEDRENLKKLYKKTRYDEDQALFTAKLRKEYNYQTNVKTVGDILANADTTKTGSEYLDSALRSKVKDEVIYSFANEQVTADNFFKSIAAVPEYTNKKIDQKLLNQAIEKESENQLIKYSAMQLDKKDAQFASLMQDYQNGIYIFKLQDDQIWGKIKLDSLQLVNFYEQNKSNYRWKDRVDFSEIFSVKDSLINKYYALLKQGENFDSLAYKYSERPGFKEKAGRFGLVEVTTSDMSEAANKLSKPGEYSAPFKSGNGYSIVRLNVKDPARIKTFEEARAEVSGQYQEAEGKRLEASYLESLKNQYKPVYFYDQLPKAFKN